MTARAIPAARKAVLPPKGTGSPCLALAPGRDRLWALLTHEEGGKTSVEWSGSFPLDRDPLSSGTGPDPQWEAALDAVAERSGRGYFDLQVALPDPSVRFEVLELEKTPGTGTALRDFLAWRFQPGKGTSSPTLDLTSQTLGQLEGKTLLMAEAVEQEGLGRLRSGLRPRGLHASVIDSAMSFRFNLFHDELISAPGALLALEPDYWSLLIWDGEGRPRFARSKGWERPSERLKDLPLEEALTEVERTVRSYVYSDKDRAVEGLYLLTREDWSETALKAAGKRTQGACKGLSIAKKLGSPRDEKLPTGLLAAGVRR